MFCQRCCNLSLPQAHPPATDAASTAASDCSVTESGCGAGQSLGTSDEMSCPAILVTLPDPSCFSDSCLVFFGTFLQIFPLHIDFNKFNPEGPKSIASLPFPRRWSQTWHFWFAHRQSLCPRARRNLQHFSAGWITKMEFARLDVYEDSSCRQKFER